jgi:hypothetical protein
MSFESIKMGRMPKLEKERIASLEIESRLLKQNLIQCLLHSTGANQHVTAGHFSVFNLIYLLREKCHELFVQLRKSSLVRTSAATTMPWYAYVCEESKQIVFYVKQLPGFSLINTTDLTILLSHHVLSVLILSSSSDWLADASNGRLNTQISHFQSQIAQLNLNDHELALLYPYLLSSITGWSTDYNLTVS